MAVPVDFYAAVVSLAAVTMLAKFVTARVGPRRGEGASLRRWRVGHLVTVGSSFSAVALALWGLTGWPAPAWWPVVSLVLVILALGVLVAYTLLEDHQAPGRSAAAHRGS